MARFRLRNKVAKGVFVAVIALILALAANFTLISPKVAYAYGCDVYNNHGGPQYAYHMTYDKCYSNPPNWEEVRSYVQFCSIYGGSTAVNTDTRLTQQPWVGGNRFYESGRYRLVGIPADCQWHGYYAHSLGPLPWPVWGCAWFYWRDYGVSYDYQCDYIQG
jgi:hypothetical protein